MSLGNPLVEQIKIYICDHNIPDISHQSRFFSTLVSGVVSATTLEYFGDLDGENVAQNNGLSEMRHQHHVWKHGPRRAAYVGFEHYRRAFMIDFLPSILIHDDAERLELRRRFARNDRDCMTSMPEFQFRSYLKKRADDCELYSDLFSNWLNRYDVILPRPLFDETVKQQWSWTHISHYWEIFVDSIAKNPYYKTHEKFFDFDLMRPSFFNMYIMKWDIFTEYMQFWADSARFLIDKLPDEPRLLGHFSERMINVYINQKIIENPALRILKLPIVYRDAKK
jgi:hypothetical protein